MPNFDEKTGIRYGVRDYHNEVIDDLKSQNRAELLKMGFSEADINESLYNADEVD